MALDPESELAAHLDRRSVNTPGSPGLCYMDRKPVMYETMKGEGCPVCDDATRPSRKHCRSRPATTIETGSGQSEDTA